MKIGILTLPLHLNYGGILQAYALQTVLERMGHEVVVINRPMEGKPAFIRSLIYYLRRLFKYYVLRRRDVSVKWEEGALKAYYERLPLNNFINDKIKNRFIQNLSEIKPTEFDAIVVGSDQVWRKAYFYSKIEDAFLLFAEKWNVRRISYSASFGKDNVDDYTVEEKRNVARLLRIFEKVSVRESSAVNVCSKEFNIEAVQMLDPTLLLSADDYRAMIDKHGAVNLDGNFFCYILDQTADLSETIREIEQRNGWKSFFLHGGPEALATESNNKKIQPVEVWLQSFRDADAVITDSFHACVFSIIFNKPFLVFGNSIRGMSRFESLLKMTGLEDRLVNSKEMALAKIGLLSEKPNALVLLDDKKRAARDFLKVLE